MNDNIIEINKGKYILIFKEKIMIKPEELEKIRRELGRQIREGYVLLPEHVELVAVLDVVDVVDEEEEKER